MSDLEAQAMNLFAEVVGLSPEQRVARLQAACGGVPELRARVEELLADHQEAETNAFLETPILSAEASELKELGRIFPKFEPVIWVGGGGMGDVYRMRHVMLDCDVALKVIRREVAEEPQFIERFRREGRAMARLDHPRIARVMDFGLAEDRYYLAMQYLDGGSLRDKLRDGPLRPKRALAIARDICDALQHAHDRDVTHRDLSPDNILFDRADNLKVGDFGLARIGGDDSLTRSEQVMGKAAYMAPEQRKSAADVDGRADIYAVGVILYEMLTGKRPEVNYPRVSEEVKVPAEVDGIIDRALQHDPERRYQSAADMKATLEAVPIDPVPDPPTVRVGRLTRAGVAAAALLLLGLGLLIWRLVSPGPAQGGELLWGADPHGGAPYVWEEGRKLKGFEVEVMEELGRRLKLRPKFVQCSWDMLPAALHRGDIHLIFNGYSWSPRRGRAMSASLPYAVTPMRLIVRKEEQGPGGVHDWSDLRRPGPNGRKWRVGTVRGSYLEQYLLDTFPNTVEVEAPADGVVGVLIALKSERLDASVQEEFTARHYLKDDFPELTVVGDPVSRGMPVVAYTARENSALRDRINDALRDMMHDGTLKKIYSHYGVWNEDTEKLPDLWRNWPPPEETAGENLWGYAWLLLKAAGMTVLLACVAMPLAMLLGVFIALGRVYGPRWLALPLNVYVEVVRGTPLLLQLFVIYYLLPDAGIFLPAFWAAVMALAINYSAYESEHYRAGLLAVPRGQMEAALTLGLTRWTALRRIVLPQALRTVVPSVTNDFIALFKDTAVCSVIAVVELTGQYQRLLVGQPRMIVTFALLTALLYLLMSYPLALLARRLERRPQTVAA